MEMEVFEYMVSIWTPVKPEKIFTSWSSVDFLWTTLQSCEFLELERMADNVQDEHGEHSILFTAVQLFKTIFQLYPVALLMLNTGSICNNTHTSTYENTSVQSLKHFS